MAAVAPPTYPCVCPGHSKAVVELAYAGSTDGNFFISACLDKVPMLRDATSGDWIGSFTGHKGAVWSAKLNADATRAATGSADFSVKLWDAITGDEVRSIDHPHIVKTVDFARGHGTLATGANDKKLRLWSLDRPEAPPAVCEHPKAVRKVSWMPDDRCLLTACEDGGVRLWDSRTCGVVREVSTGTVGIMDMELAADGKTITVAGGKAVTLLDADSLAVRVTHPVAFEAEAASLHPTHSRYLVAGGSDVWVHVIDAVTGAELATQKGHHGIVHCLRFAPDGRTYTSGADDATIRIWKADEYGPA